MAVKTPTFFISVNVKSNRGPLFSRHVLGEGETANCMLPFEQLEGLAEPATSCSAGYCSTND